MAEPSGATRSSSAPLAAAAGAAVLLIASITAIHLATREPAESRPPAPTARGAGAVDLDVPRGLISAAAGATAPPVAAAPRQASASAGADDAPASRATREHRASQPSGLQVLFRLDPRLSRGSHLGTRWVSPATHSGRGDGSLYTVQARVRRARGSEARASDPEWLAAEPDMVAVTPERGSDVEITVLREGRSTLTVTDGGASRTLVVDAARRAGTWRVDISQ